MHYFLWSQIKSGDESAGVAVEFSRCILCFPAGAWSMPSRTAFTFVELLFTITVTARCPSAPARFPVKRGLVPKGGA
jgi:hypothetical protein